jgi:hypothetical protein
MGKELSYMNFEILKHPSTILMKGAQSLTILDKFSTLQPPPHTNRCGPGKLLELIVLTEEWTLIKPQSCIDGLLGNEIGIVLNLPCRTK